MGSPQNLQKHTLITKKTIAQIKAVGIVKDVVNVLIVSIVVNVLIAPIVLIVRILSKVKAVSIVRIVLVVIVVLVVVGVLIVLIAPTAVNVLIAHILHIVLIARIVITVITVLAAITLLIRNTANMLITQQTGGSKMQYKITQEMVDYCRNMGNRKIKPRRKAFGLCTEFKEEFENQGVMTNLGHHIDFTKYPNFSGNPHYPIKSFNNRYAPITKHKLTKNLWDKRTKYGKERYKFCLWCADELERLMNKQEKWNEK